MGLCDGDDFVIPQKGIQLTPLPSTLERISAEKCLCIPCAHGKITPVGMLGEGACLEDVRRDQTGLGVRIHVDRLGDAKSASDHRLS